MSILPSACWTEEYSHPKLYPHSLQIPQVLCFVQGPLEHVTTQLHQFTTKHLIPRSARAEDLVRLSLLDKALRLQNEILFFRPSTT